jgi:hypothetical protein
MLTVGLGILICAALLALFIGFVWAGMMDKDR